MPAAIRADEEPSLERLKAVLPYLASHVPEQQRQAEELLQSGAAAHYAELEKSLTDMQGVGRERLFSILAATEHERRIPLCMRVLRDRDARRNERMAAMQALASVNGDTLLLQIEHGLAEADIGDYQRMQLCALLGTLPSARAQGVAEQILQRAEAGSLLAFAAEEAALRSTLDSPFAQPAWSRYQERHPQAPRAALRELQAIMDDLALPSAPERAAAEERLNAIIRRDERVLLALCRSRWPERAAFALRRLKAEPPRELQLAAQMVMLELAGTGEQTVALLAMDVGIAGRPPTAEELEQLRPVTSAHAIARLESILEAMTRGGDLAELRLQNEKLSAKVRPLLLRLGPMDPEVRALRQELAGVRQRLSALEKIWADGWRREFEAEILSARSN
jgi:hypothetical protein